MGNSRNMSLFDKLPLDITEIIYKASLEDHFKEFHSNFIVFHLKCAQRRLTYRFIRFRKFDNFINEMMRLYAIIEDGKITMQGKQDNIFYIYIACKLVDYNVKLLKKIGANSLILNAKSKFDELFTSMDMF